MKERKNNANITDARFKSPEFPKYLKDLVQDAKFRFSDEGMVADYIPELRMALRGKCGIALHFPDDTRIGVGDHCKFARNPDGLISENERKNDDSFTLQSISKVFALLYVLEELGTEDVFKRIGKEPTGDPFNAAPRVREVGGKRIPYNPLINVGAIFITSLFPGKNRDGKFNRFFDFVKKMCGDSNMIVDEAVYRSEKATGHNNRALAWQMIADGIFFFGEKSEASSYGKYEVEQVGLIEDVLDNYFRQCSILVNCDHLARAACVLATGGIDPTTKKRIAKKDNVCSVISLMATCGLYDGSGEFAYNVGLPGKSGVGGGIMAVIPGRFGVATFSPALDGKGNSVRGLYMLEQLTQAYKLNIFQQPIQTGELKFYNTSKDLKTLAYNMTYGVNPPKDFGIASYIPELSSANASHTGVSVCFNDGRIISGGNHNIRFSMQAISNVFGLLYVLSKKGEGEVFRNVGNEPSGRPFNEIWWSAGKPSNPMINVGAIVIASMIPDRYGPAYKKSDDDLLGIDDFLDFVRKLCGNSKIEVNYRVFQSERRTGYNNRSLAWLMNDRGVFNNTLKRQEINTIDNTIIEDILGVYFRLCSIEVTCDDLARFGAVLANEGRDLKTKEYIVSPRNVTIATSLMASGGLYDESGEFAYNVGIPAKSGVSGGLVGVVPGKLGIATYSPIKDDKGNSFKGIKLFEEISKKEKLSVFRGGW